MGASHGHSEDSPEETELIYWSFDYEFDIMTWQVKRPIF
jgi:hypothetical protein